jgi:hypothetical protein
MTTRSQNSRGSSRYAALAATVLWLVVQNTLLLASEPGQLDAAPLVVARALFGVAGLIVTRHPGMTLLLVSFLALVISCGVLAIKDSEIAGLED